MGILDLRVIGPYVVVEPVKANALTTSGIILPSTLWKMWRIGRVVNIGVKEYISIEMEKTADNVRKKVLVTYTRPSVYVGDFILFEAGAQVHKIDLDGKYYYFIHYGDCSLAFSDPNILLPM